MANRPEIPIEIRRRILIESGHRCAVDGTPTPLEFAHIIPWHESKEHKVEDLICLCAGCHERAHKEEWGEKTLREYKQKPWVMRQFGKKDDMPDTGIGKITMKIEGDLDEESQKYILSAIAAYLKISPHAVRVILVERGCVRITIELPTESAKALLTAYEQKGPELYKYLSPFILLDLHQEIEKREKLLNNYDTSMNSENLTITHPFDWFDYYKDRRERTAKEDKCFVIMPFEPEFDLVYDTIKDALENIMMGGVYRADKSKTSPVILEKILDGISSARLVIADLTELNPNVFYELGITHIFTKDVLLITQNIDNLPFNIHGLDCEIYNKNSRKGLDDLAKLVRERAIELKKRDLPTLIKGGMERTKRIVSYMVELEKQLSQVEIKNMVIRHEAGLSSLSNIPYDSSDEESIRKSYFIVEEREKLIEFLREGAKMRVIISPFGSYIIEKNARPRNRKRLEKLLEFLNSKESKNCEFVVSEHPRSSLIFLGERILFEGYNPKPGMGYDSTGVHYNKNYIKDRIKVFDDYFRIIYESNREKLPNKDPEFLPEFVIQTIREVIKRIDDIDDIDNKERQAGKDDNESNNEYKDQKTK